MSDGLYRFTDKSYLREWHGVIETMIQQEVVELVPRCEHGYYDMHLIGSIAASPMANGGRTERWCSGARLGVEEDS